MTSLSTLSGFQGRDPEMLQTVKDACRFDPKAIDYALSDQIESLEDLVGHEPGAAEAFFKKTYVTGGMHTLLRQGLQRLAGSSGQAVFELKQSMGGGKTHSMLALGYLARQSRSSPGSSRKKSRKDSRRPTARVVAISGRSISRDKHLWGDIAEQLGQGRRLRRILQGQPAGAEREGLGRPHRRRADPDPARRVAALFRLRRHAARRRRHARGRHGLRVSNLLSAALKLKRLCIVISNLSGSYHDATKQIAAMIQKAVGNLQQEAGPSGQEHHSGRTRLRRDLSHPPQAPAARRARRRRRGLRGDRLLRGHLGRREIEDRDEVRRADRRRDRLLSYPFHPSFKHILALFKDNESFRQTRGLMTLAAMMVRSVQAPEANDVYLVGCQHIDLTQADIRDGMTNIYDLSGAIAHDIAGTGERPGPRSDHRRADGPRRRQPGRPPRPDGVAARGQRRGERAHQAPTRREPRRAPPFGDRVRRGLREAARRMLVSASARQRRVGVRPRTRTFARRSRNTPRAPRSPRSTPSCSGASSPIFEPRRKVAYSEILALPKIEDIKTGGGRLLLVLSPDRKVPPEDAKRLFDAVVQKNNFCILTGDGSDLAKLEDQASAASGRSPRSSEEDGGDKSPNVAELNEEAELAEFEFNSTLTSLFNRLYYPGRHPKDGDGLLSVASQDDADQGQGRQVEFDRRRDRRRGGAGVDRSVEALQGDHRRQRRCPSHARRADAVDRRRRPARPLEGRRGAGHLQRALALAAGEGTRRAAQAGGQHRRVARQRRRLRREGPLPAGEDGGEGCHPHRATTTARRPST